MCSYSINNTIARYCPSNFRIIIIGIAYTFGEGHNIDYHGDQELPDDFNPMTCIFN